MTSDEALATAAILPRPMIVREPKLLRHGVLAEVAVQPLEYHGIVDFDGVTAWLAITHLVAPPGETAAKLVAVAVPPTTS